MNRAQRNIREIYSQATPAELEHGLTWYFQAHQKARELAVTYGYSVSAAAGVIAALSPSQGWRANLACAEKVLQAHKAGVQPGALVTTAYPANTNKALQIAGGMRVSQAYKSLKVLSFYRNIVSPWTSTSVTVDGHAWCIWSGTRVVLQRVPTRIFRPLWYTTISEDYKAVAAELGLKPWQVQATTWVTWRRLNVPGIGAYELD